MIFTDRTITVKKGVSSIDDTIVLYRGDKEVEIRFTLNESSPFRFGIGAEPNIIEKTEAAYGQLIIKRPNDLPAVFSEIAPTNEGKIVFTITAEMIDEITEVGNYTFQIRLLDESRNSRATLPEVVNGIEIREPIASEDSTNEVGVAAVGYALTTAGVSEDAFDSQGNYNKTTWATGDRITAAKLNKMEAGIDGVNKKVASGGTGSNNASDISITDAGNCFTSTDIEGALQEAGSQIKDIKNISQSEELNILEFGGKADGTFDNADIIQNIINENIDKNITIRLPLGEIFIGKTIKLESNTIIKGSGQILTILKTKSDTMYPVFLFAPTAGETVENVELLDFSIDGTNKVDGPGHSNLITCYSKGNLKNITIDNIGIKINGDNNSCISIGSDDTNTGEMENVRITNCNIIANGGMVYGINIGKKSKYIWIENNYVSLTNNDSYNNIGVYGDSKIFHVNNNTCINGGHSPIAVSPASYGEISGNYVDNGKYTDEGAIEIEFKDSHGGVDTSHEIIVDGNIVKNSANGILITTRGDEPNPVRNVILSNNIIYDCTTAINMTKGININVASNIIENCNEGLFGYTLNNLAVTNNTIHTQTAALTINNSSDCLKINNNDISTTGDSSTIVLVSKCNDVNISNNLIKNATQYVIKLEKGGKNCVITDNILKGGIRSIYVGAYTGIVSENISILNNQILDFTQCGIDISRTNNTDGLNKCIKIENNLFVGSDNRVFTHSLIKTHYNENLIINNNMSKNNTGRSIDCEYCKLFNMSNNVFEGDYSLIPSGSLGGIRVADSSIGVINSNTLKSQQYCPILVTSNSSGISVTNNNIDGSDDMGISLQGGANNCIVKNNILSNIAADTKVNNSGTDNDVSDNKIISAQNVQNTNI